MTSHWSEEPSMAVISGGNTTFIRDWNGSLNFLGFIFLVVAMFTMYTLIAHDK